MTGSACPPSAFPVCSALRSRLCPPYTSTTRARAGTTRARAGGTPARAPSVLEDRHVLGRQRPGQRLKEGIDIRDLLIRHDDLAIGRHLVDGLTELTHEAVKRHCGLGEDRGRAVHCAALPGAPMAGEAPGCKIEPLALGGVARRGILGPGHTVSPCT